MMRSPSAAPVAGSNTSQTLFILRGANMTLTTDQAFTKQGSGFTNYIVTAVYGVCKTGAFGVACTGGIYAAASKGGDIIVSAAQGWSGLSVVGMFVTVSAVNVLAKLETATPILSLTTGNTGALTADIFIVGVVVD